MSVQLPRSADEVIWKGFRDLRDLDHSSPGISFEREAMRELGLLDEKDGVVDGHQVRVTIFEDGRAIIDLQTE